MVVVRVLQDHMMLSMSALLVLLFLMMMVRKMVMVTGVMVVMVCVSPPLATHTLEIKTATMVRVRVPSARMS